MGNRILVNDGDKPQPTTPSKSKMARITHAPPHKAAAYIVTASEIHPEQETEVDLKCALNHSSDSLVFQTVVTPTTEFPLSAPEVVQQRTTMGEVHSAKEAERDKETTSRGDKSPISTTLQTHNTMPSTSDKASPRLVPRLSIDLSNIPPSPTLPPSAFKRQARRNSKSPSPVGNPKNDLVAYNLYGEIYRIQDMHRPKNPANLTVLETLRLMDKVYGYECRAAVAKVIEVQMEERTYPDQNDEKPMPPPIRSLSSWDYADFPMSPLPETPEGHQTTLVYNGPPRVLEIGCGNGSWCFASKERHPDWIIEGVDDSDHWTEAHPYLHFRDFTTPPSRESPLVDVDYFKGFQLSQEHPEFTQRNLNALLAHHEPIPHNLYGLIRGRDVFDRVESYKEFLEDVRLILQPDGVVEFVELDPRPREDFSGPDVPKQEEDDHTSGPVTDWTDKIADRFKDPETEEVGTSVPGWTARVKERQKATLRPKDGVPASQLKSWLEGAGFWDVKEIVFRLQIGGETRGGQMLRDLVQKRIDVENEIQLLNKELPAMEPGVVDSGLYYFNLHVVTGRKPKYPRPGDLLLDGTRQEMTNSKYDAMAKLNDAKSNQWKRFDLDGKLTSMMKSLGAIHGSETTTPAAGSPAKSMAVLRGKNSESSIDTDRA